jgi:hypothetical protein
MSDPTSPAPVDFDGFIEVMTFDGGNPAFPGVDVSIYRIERVSSATYGCDSCGRFEESEQPSMPYYRHVPLHTHVVGEPDLGICHRCLVVQWTERIPDNAPIVDDAARVRMYDPRPASYTTR